MKDKVLKFLSGSKEVLILIGAVVGTLIAIIVSTEEAIESQPAKVEVVYDSIPTDSISGK